MPIYCMLDTLTLKLHLQGVWLSLLHMQLPKSLTKQTIEEVMRSQQYMIWKEKRSFDYHTTFYIHSFFFFLWKTFYIHSWFLILQKQGYKSIMHYKTNPPVFWNGKYYNRGKKTKTIAQKQKQLPKNKNKITHLHDTYGDNLYKNSIRKAKFLNLKFYNTSWFQL